MTIKETVEKLIEKNISISFIESCTGGALAHALVSYPGVSKIFSGSIVSYSDEFKERYAGVKKRTIEKYGVVSEEVALEMVAFLKRETSADICVSVTGNCGPTQGDKYKSIGVVFVGYYGKNPSVFSLKFDGSRTENIDAIVEFVFTELIPSKI